MALIFFVSSLGDTDLAKETIKSLITQGYQNKIIVVPVTDVAEKNTDDYRDSKRVHRVLLEELIQRDKIQSEKGITDEELEKINLYVKDNEVKQVFIGVPSPLNEKIPFQLAQALDVSCVVAYEYMFTAPPEHCFWESVNKLASKKNCHFAVPFAVAREEVLKKNPVSDVHIIGHVSVDRGLASEIKDCSAIRDKLGVNKGEELVFSSGTTQPTEVDEEFLEALLLELSTGKYPNIQLRFGIHPGVKDLDDYLQRLLNNCMKYPSVKNQFKIILPSLLVERLKCDIPEEQHAFIIYTDLSGSEAAQAANKVAQAVPGALLNQAALEGKPAYFHNKTADPYLPRQWFSDNVAAFFSAQAQKKHTKEEMGIAETAPNRMAKLLGGK